MKKVSSPEEGTLERHSASNCLADHVKNVSLMKIFGVVPTKWEEVEIFRGEIKKDDSHKKRFIQFSGRIADRDNSDLLHRVQVGIHMKSESLDVWRPLAVIMTIHQLADCAVSRASDAFYNALSMRFTAELAHDGQLIWTKSRVVEHGGDLELFE